MGFKMDLLGISACKSVLVMFCPLQMENGITESKAPLFFPLRVRGLTIIQIQDTPPISGSDYSRKAMQLVYKEF